MKKLFAEKFLIPNWRDFELQDSLKFEKELANFLVIFFEIDIQKEGKRDERGGVCVCVSGWV